MKICLYSRLALWILLQFDEKNSKFAKFWFSVKCEIIHESWHNSLQIDEFFDIFSEMTSKSSKTEETVTEPIVNVTTESSNLNVTDNTTSESTTKPPSNLTKEKVSNCFDFTNYFDHKNCTFLLKWFCAILLVIFFVFLQCKIR